MKYTILTLAIFISVLSSQAAETREELKASVIQILNEQNWEAYKALTYKKGMTDYDYETMESLKSVIIDGRKVISGEFSDLPEGHKTSFIYDGRAFEPTISPMGLLKLEQEGGGSTLQYAKDGDQFVLVGTKSEDLGWEGPADVQLGVVIIGHNTQGLKVEASWNASGRDFSEEFDHTSTTFFGQYVETVKVTTDNPDAAYQLRIMEDGKEIYKSDKKKGIGEIQYTRNVNKTE
mgnify:FL=1|tara:strand:+ start:374 stop:1075 length:702 start_codon:yes stop_codon:yes gene_type:complete